MSLWVGDRRYDQLLSDDNLMSWLGRDDSYSVNVASGIGSYPAESWVAMGKELSEIVSGTVAPERQAE